MKNVTVARRYAKALYELARETDSLDDVMQGMSNITLALKESPGAAKVLLNPLIKPEEKESLVKIITSNKLVLKFMSLLSKRKRQDLFAMVYEQLSLLSDEAKGVRRVLVRSAVSLTDQQKKEIERNLAVSFGGLIMGHFEVAKDLIGGIWVRMGDNVLDVSLRGRFDDLKQYLAHSAN